MRIVTSMQITLNNQAVRSIACLNFEHVMQLGRTLVVTIRDSDTGQEERIAFKTVYDCLSYMKAAMPYGFIMGNDFANDTRHSTVVAIDDMSWKFLEYVERVHPAAQYRLPNGRELEDRGVFKAADIRLSLFEYELGGWKSYCTLFQALHAVRLLPQDGFCYLNCYELDYHICKSEWFYCYKVEFSNLKAAKQMLLRANMLYTNPILQT